MLLFHNNKKNNHFHPIKRLCTCQEEAVVSVCEMIILQYSYIHRKKEIKGTLRISNYTNGMVPTYIVNELFNIKNKRLRSLNTFTGK